jgi:hypothetical protein
MMKKLTLDLDSLEVESFQPADAQHSRGTVIGADAFLTGPAACVTVSCGDSKIRPCLEAGELAGY